VRDEAPEPVCAVDSSLFTVRRPRPTHSIIPSGNWDTPDLRRCNPEGSS